MRQISARASCSALASTVSPCRCRITFRGIAAAVDRSGIGHLRIHDCRHTAAVLMLGAGVPMEKVSQVLGHSNTATTERVYARFLPQHMQDAVNVLDFARARGVSNQ
ncbi:tyrosine-type recombinase/integrase [Cognatiyoonia sp. IB215446]|uniref:tyrosine-type recombinase/integrase n=1 Tax=Cognatiyoonia sp. IB215446 TaxID=3097355 RepID=UPI002A12B32C|nr:tyrosine-type recombinase/integrase [Cognatiyoonia sp. IB215446]MDX8348556.1 tyrosine-type recombinase/integrase [Cognatiyoonia sp. IB215446]